MAQRMIDDYLMIAGHGDVSSVGSVTEPSLTPRPDNTPLKAK